MTDNVPPETPPPEAPPPRSALRRYGPWLLRILVPTLLVIWVWRFADRDKFMEALRSIPLSLLLPALLLGVVNVSLGGIRWRLLMRGFGARQLPGIPMAIRVFFVGLFYNTFIPGSVGGDVVRGVVSRRMFDNPVTSFVVVLLERLIGLSALGLLFAAGLIWGPKVVAVHSAWSWGAVLIAVGVVLVIGVLLGGRLSFLWRRIPRAERPMDLIGVFGISFVGHCLNITTIYLLARGMGLSVGALALAFVVPVALVAAILPIAILGMGPREVAMVALLRVIGVPAEQGVALSLAFAFVVTALAALGGVVQLVTGRINLEGGASG